MNEMNIHIIANLQRYVRSYGLPKLPISGLGRGYEHGLEALPGKPTPSIKDHRNAKNSYFSRYGDIWVDKLKSSSSMPKCFCITDMIQFIIREEMKPMKGFVREDDLFIVHDYLLLITAKETIKWTKRTTTSIVGCCP